ncbi:MAG TPA: hypothetical protein VFZ51_03530 [Woeseiaceae bacterium]
MNEAIRELITQLLSELRRDLDEVPETGEFPDRRREAALPPPYAPRRLVLTLIAADGYPEFRHIDGRVEDEHGYSSQDQFMGTSAQLRAALDNEEATAKIERFLEPILQRVDDLISAVQPLDVPLVAIKRNGVLYAALDPRRTEFERWGPGDLHISKWHLLLHDHGEWRDAGVAHEQAESERFYLQSRVLKTIGSFHERTVGEFTFSVWEGTFPPVPQKSAAVSTEIDERDAVAARLLTSCRDVINESTNFEQAFIAEIKSTASPDPNHDAPENTPPAGGAAATIGIALLGVLFGLFLLWVAVAPIKEALQGNPDYASLLIFGVGGLLFVVGFLLLLRSAVLKYPADLLRRMGLRAGRRA